MKKRLAVSRRRRRQTAVGAWLMAMSLAARGAAAADAALPEVVVTGDGDSYRPAKASSPKYTQPLRDTPQTVTVVPQAVIEAQGATTLRDVLRNVPGISIQAGEGGVPAGDNLSIRGFGARTDMFIDGVRDIAGYARDPFNFEQIEVVKGPSSSFGGRGSTGGSVNMATKTPRLNSFRRAEISGGTSQYKRVTADVNQGLAPLGLDSSAFRLNLMWHDAAVPARDYARNSRWGVAPSFIWGLGSPTRLTVHYLHLAQENRPDYGIPFVPETHNVLVDFRGKPAPADWQNSYALPDRDYEHVVTDVPTITLEHDFDDSLSLRNLTRYGRTYRKSIISPARFPSANSTDVWRELKSRDQVDAILSDQLNLTANFETAGVRHTAVLGVEAAYEKSDNTPLWGTNGPVTDLYNPDPGQVYPFEIMESTKTFAIAKNTAFYAFDTLKFGERWELSGGARWDRVDVTALTVPVTGDPTRLGRLDEVVSGRAGLVFKPRENGSVYASYGTSFNPAAENLTLNNTATASNRVAAGPEQSVSYEVGTKWDVFDERLTLASALFLTDKLNARTEDPANAGDFVVLEGRQRAQGVELSAAGSLSERWKLFGGYTYLDGRILSSKNPGEVGAPLANAPRHTANLWAAFDPVPDVELGLGAQYSATRYNNATANRRAVPGYALFDAMASYKVNSQLTLRLNAYNLADQRYASALSGGHFIPGAGRSLVGTASLSF